MKDFRDVPPALSAHSRARAWAHEQLCKIQLENPQGEETIPAWNQISVLSIQELKQKQKEEMFAPKWGICQLRRSRGLGLESFHCRNFGGIIQGSFCVVGGYKANNNKTKTNPKTTRGREVLGINFSKHQFLLGSCSFGELMDTVESRIWIIQRRDHSLKAQHGQKSLGGQI